MRVHSPFQAAVLALGTLAVAGDVAAQDAAANPHVGHVTTAFPSTPDQQGFLPLAVADSRVAAQHAAFAMRDPSDLAAMKLHAGHVLHAVDPSQIERGPGSGYGVKQAAENSARHIEMAAEVEGTPQAVITHSVHIAASSRNTARRAEEIAALAKRIQAAGTATEAGPLVEELNTLSERLMVGLDANGDGRVGWQEGEGGLETVQQHVDLMLGM
jgi:hypothetical protein